MIPSEVESLLQALSEAQDQLLAISTLAQNTEHNFNIEELLSFFLEQAGEILEARAVFIVYHGKEERFLSSPYDYFDRKEISTKLDWTDFQRLGDEKGIPLYALSRQVDDKTRLALGFSVDTPQEALNPTLKLASAITDQVSVQLTNLILHEELLAQTRLQAEMDAARRVQLSLLPKQIPPVADIQLDVAVHFNSARATGGDFYDFSITPRGLSFTVGDISGKGLPAALLMAISLNSFRNKGIFLSDATPQRILERVNEDVYNDFTQAGAFATVFTGYCDSVKRKLVFANAGHSPVIYCPAEGGVTLLEADGPALGVLPESLSECQELPFKSGDLIFIGTDGFSEAENEKGDFFGYDRLLQEVEDLRAHSAKEIKDHLVAAINEFAGETPQSDDQTLLVIKRL